MPHRTFFVLSNKFRSRVALTPKAVIWNVMQITKIHFVTSVYSSTNHGGGKPPT
jgi:hypothetical protein